MRGRQATAARERTRTGATRPPTLGASSYALHLLAVCRDLVGGVSVHGVVPRTAAVVVEPSIGAHQLIVAGVPVQAGPIAIVGQLVVARSTDDRALALRRQNVVASVPEEDRTIAMHRDGVVPGAREDDLRSGPNPEIVRRKDVVVLVRSTVVRDSVIGHAGVRRRGGVIDEVVRSVS